MAIRREAMRIGIAAGLSAVVAIVGGCAEKRKPVYLDTQANFGAVRKVAIMPFQNYSSDAHAADKVRQILSIELLRAGAFEIVESGDIAPALAAARVEDVPGMTTEQMRIVGEKLEAQALWFGTVQEMTVDRSGGVASPTVIIQFKLVDSQTGGTIWSSIVSREGVGFGARLFGLGSQSTNAVVQDLIKDALDTLIK